MLDWDNDKIIQRVSDNFEKIAGDNSQKIFYAWAEQILTQCQLTLRCIYGIICMGGISNAK